MSIVRAHTLLPVRAATIKYLSEDQVNALTAEFQKWYDSTQGARLRKKRGRYWLTYLVLRFTGARLGEVLELDDRTDIDFRNAEIRIRTLKRKGRPIRVVPVPSQVITEIATYLAEYSDAKGTVFKIKDRNFRRKFAEIALKAGIPRDLAHPHVLRHTRAVELIRAGVPISAVQDLLGHAYLSTTAIYLKLSGQEVKAILRDKGLI